MLLLTAVDFLFLALDYFSFLLVPQLERLARARQRLQSRCRTLVVGLALVWRPSFGWPEISELGLLEAQIRQLDERRERQRAGRRGSLLLLSSLLERMKFERLASEPVARSNAGDGGRRQRSAQERELNGGGETQVQTTSASETTATPTTIPANNGNKVHLIGAQDLLVHQLNWLEFDVGLGSAWRQSNELSENSNLVLASNIWRQVALDESGCKSLMMMQTSLSSAGGAKEEAAAAAAAARFVLVQQLDGLELAQLERRSSWLFGQLQVHGHRLTGLYALACALLERARLLAPSGAHSPSRAPIRPRNTLTSEKEANNKGDDDDDDDLWLELVGLQLDKSNGQQNSCLSRYALAVMLCEHLQLEREAVKGAPTLASSFASFLRSQTSSPSVGESRETCDEPICVLDPADGEPPAGTNWARDQLEAERRCRPMEVPGRQIGQLFGQLASAMPDERQQRTRCSDPLGELLQVAERFGARRARDGRQFAQRIGKNFCKAQRTSRAVCNWPKVGAPPAAAAARGRFVKNFLLVCTLLLARNLLLNYLESWQRELNLKARDDLVRLKQLVPIFQEELSHDHDSEGAINFPGIISASAAEAEEADKEDAAMGEQREEEEEEEEAGFVFSAPSDAMSPLDGNKPLKGDDEVMMHAIFALALQRAYESGQLTRESMGEILGSGELDAGMASLLHEMLEKTKRQEAAREHEDKSAADGGAAPDLGDTEPPESGSTNIDSENEAPSGAEEEQEEASSGRAEQAEARAEL